MAYIVAQKNASCTIRYVMHQLEGLEFDWKSPSSDIKFFKFGQMLDIERLDDIRKDYKTFTVVRNPYDRVLSFFTQKVVNELRDMQPTRNFGMLIEKYGFINEKEAFTISFEEFIDKLYNVPSSNYEHHLCTQYDNLEVEKLDFILRFEDLENEIKNKLLKDVDIYIDVQKINTSKPEGYRPFYNKKMREQVEEIYEIDFKKLNYKF